MKCFLAQILCGKAVNNRLQPTLFNMLRDQLMLSIYYYLYILCAEQVVCTGSRCAPQACLTQSGTCSTSILSRLSPSLSRTAAPVEPLCKISTRICSSALPRPDRSRARRAGPDGRRLEKYPNRREAGRQSLDRKIPRY